MHRRFHIVLTLALVLAGTTTPSLADNTGWSLAYAHDKNGNPLGGDINVLRQAVENGREVRMVTTSKNGYIYSTTAEYLWLKDGIVYAQNISSVGTQFQGKTLKFHDDPYYWMIILSSLGDRDMIRWGLEDHKLRDRNSDKVAIKWFIR